MTKEQKEWFRKEARAFIDKLGSESIDKGVSEEDYYTEGLKIVQETLDVEKEDYTR